MLRTGASRLGFRAVATPVPSLAGAALRRAAPPAQWTTKFSSVASRRPQLQTMPLLKPVQSAILRRALADKIDHKAEDKYAHEKLEPHPELVSATSTMHPIGNSEVGVDVHQNEQAKEVTSALKGDLDTIKETFSLSEVPRQAYFIGLAGVIPYLATSLSTVVCAFEINNGVGSGWLMSPGTAEAFLHVLEPLQIGYGAVILSFLGAIHWGLEFAGYDGYHGYRRLAIGVVAPAVAWPTVLMPVEYALISQLCAFVMLYYVDARATYRGWTPPWYAIYRFVLTFVVGASIVLTLVGRGEVSHKIARLPGAVDRVSALRESAQDTLAKEEEGIRAEAAAKEDEED